MKSQEYTIREDGFLAQIIELAHLYRWKVHHVRSAWSAKGYRTPIQGDPGFPDLVLVRNQDERSRIIVAEVKAERGRLTYDQQDWLKKLERCPGVESYIWKPRMWDDIVGVLQ